MCTQQIYFYSFSWPMDTGCLPSLSSVDRYVAFLPSLSCVLLQCYLAFKRMQCASQQPASLSSFMNDCIFQGYIFQLRLSLMFISCSGISLQGSRDFLPALTCRVVHFFFHAVSGYICILKTLCFLKLFFVLFSADVMFTCLRSYVCVHLCFWARQERSSIGKQYNYFRILH